MNALLGVGRLNAFRLNELDAATRERRESYIRVTLDGAPLRVRVGSMTIHDAINDAPNTCTFTVDSQTPPHLGGRLRVELGLDVPILIFVGILQRADYSYIARPTIVEWACEAIDDTARSDWLRPFGAWSGISATDVAAQLVSSYAPGYSSAGVQAGLPPVTIALDGSERLNDALRLIAKLIGGYFYWEDYVLHLFTGGEAGDAPEAIDGRPGQILNDPPVTLITDDAQLRTRVYGKGHAEPTLAAVDAGESKLPIANAVLFNASGGRAIIESQRIFYGGIVLGGAGAVVGPGVTPSAGPTLAALEGGAITPGLHNYAYTWRTAAGETLPSPIAQVGISASTVPPPTIDYLSSGVQWGGPAAGIRLEYAIAIVNPGVATTAASPILSLTASGYRPTITWTITADMRGRQVVVYRQDNGGGWNSVTVATYAANQGIGIQHTVTDPVVWSSGPGQPLPSVGTFVVATVAVAGIAIGPAGVTSRRLYRTAANNGGLQLLATLADNLTTTYTDAAADSALGAIPPATDGSGLLMTQGQVLPGVTVLPVSSAAWALPSGGWVILGNGRQVVRYTGISGNTLTGIPAAGNGAITAPINYNTTASGAPMLTGVAGLFAGVRAGAPVALWVQRDDVQAQVDLAARVGGTGVIDHLIVDDRRGEPSLIAICDADLAMHSRPRITVRYTCFDPHSRSGKPVAIHVAALGIGPTTLTIQEVTIDSFGHGPPRFHVTAGNAHTSLEDMLRQMVGTLAEGF